MAAKKKLTKIELRTQLSAIRARHQGPDASYEAAAARAQSYLESLVAEGFGPTLAKNQSLSMYLAEWKVPVALVRKPLRTAQIKELEEAVGARLPASYAAFLDEWGGARFYRSPAEEAGAFLFSPAEALAKYAELKGVYAKVFKDYAQHYPAHAATYGEARSSWEDAPLRADGLFSVRDVEALNLFPICPYYDGAFCIALHARNDRGEAPFFCVSPSGDPLTFTLYGHSMLEWFSSMTTWSIAELSPLIV